jgi:hypothetical protein
MATIPSFFSGGDWPNWLVLAMALVAWVVFLRAATRRLMRSQERVQCPVERRSARIVYVRAPDGSRDEVVSCSLLGEGTPITCDQDCLHPAH